MKKNLLLTLSFIAVLFISSCKDDTKEPTPAKTKTENLCSAPWKATAATIDPAIDVGGTQVTDWYSQFEACMKDDLVKYESNKTGTYDEGATKCDPTDPQNTPFTWTFDLSETKLTEDGDTYDIIQLDETTLKYSFVYDGADIGGTPGIKYKMTATFKH